MLPKPGLGEDSPGQQSRSQHIEQIALFSRVSSVIQTAALPTCE